MIQELSMIILLILSIIFAALSVAHPNIMYAVIFFLGLNLSLGILYYSMGAPLVALFQIGIFAGAIVVLFLITVMLTYGGKMERQ